MSLWVRGVKGPCPHQLDGKGPIQRCLVCKRWFESFIAESSMLDGVFYRAWRPIRLSTRIKRLRQRMAFW